MTRPNVVKSNSGHRDRAKGMIVPGAVTKARYIPMGMDFGGGTRGRGVETI